MNIRTEKFYR